jgi:non-specific serine/threonine protein kinase
MARQGVIIDRSTLSFWMGYAAAEIAVNAIEEARGVNHPAVLCIALAWAASFVLLSLGDMETVERYGDELIDYAARNGMRPIFLAGLCVQGCLAARRGDPGAGVDLLRRSLNGMREASYQPKSGG